MHRHRQVTALLLAAAMIGWGGVAAWAESRPGKGGDRPPVPPGRTFAPPGPPDGPIAGTPGIDQPPPGSPAPPTKTPPTSSPQPLAVPQYPPPEYGSTVPPGALAPPALVGGGGGATGVIGFVHVQVDDPADAQRLALALGLTVRQVSADGRECSLAAPPGVDLTQLLRRLRGDPRVKQAHLEALEFVPPAR